MKINLMKINLDQWIITKTQPYSTIVEFGCGLGLRLRILPKNKLRIGIDASPKYLDANHMDYDKVCGDMREYRDLLEPEILERDNKCAMFIDSIEHITEEDAFKLVEQMKEDFECIIFMIPEGNHPQDKDLLGYGEHSLQTHRSTWDKDLVTKLGVDEILIDPTFHANTEGKDSGCIFAVWTKDE